MRIFKLKKNQVEYLYNKSMKVDFPDNERKPLAMILKGMDNGTYECLGMIDESACSSFETYDELLKEIICYTIFVKSGKNYLFDYFAVIGNLRNKGLGTLMLDLIREYYKDADCVFGEVENPEYAKNPEDESIQIRRMNFYLRNGYVDTGARCWLFGVHYIILELDLGKGHSRKEIEEIYMSHYKSMLPKVLFKTMVKIEDRAGEA